MESVDVPGSFLETLPVTDWMFVPGAATCLTSMYLPAMLGWRRSFSI